MLYLDGFDLLWWYFLLYCVVFVTRIMNNSFLCESKVLQLLHWCGRCRRVFLTDSIHKENMQNIILLQSCFSATNMIRFLVYPSVFHFFYDYCILLSVNLLWLIQFCKLELEFFLLNVRFCSWSTYSKVNWGWGGWGDHGNIMCVVYRC